MLAYRRTLQSLTKCVQRAVEANAANIQATYHVNPDKLTETGLNPQFSHFSSRGACAFAKRGNKSRGLSGTFAVEGVKTVPSAEPRGCFAM